MIRTRHLKFIDALRYLAPGFTLRRFITSFAPEVPLGKIWFPYEYIKSLEKLKEPQLPNYDSFYSSLKGMNLLEEDELNFEKMISSGLSEDAAINRLGGKYETGEERYNLLEKLWVSNNMKTLKDFLKLYLQHDLLPFLKAVENMRLFYDEKNIEPFIGFSTLPSLTLPLLFNSISPEHYRPFLFLDLTTHDQVRKGVLGGLALIGKRFVDCSFSKIKADKYGRRALRARTIVGFDFNSLYGGLNGKIEHYGGIYCLREKQNGYEPQWSFETPQKNVGMCKWLHYREEIDKTWIQSSVNVGEKCVFYNNHRIFLDGFSPERQFAYEFLGCFWHSHIGECQIQTLNPSDIHPVRKNISHEAKTMKRLEFLQDHYKQVHFIWECEWQQQLHNNSELDVRLQNLLIPSFQKSLRVSTEIEMLNAIERGDVFGIVFCDVTVPDDLREKFSDFPPIYIKMKDFTTNDLCEPMRGYALRNNLKPPNNFLTTQMSGSNLVLPTEMIQYYLQEGFSVSNLVKIIQFEPGYRPFEKFLLDRVKERREGFEKGATVVSNMAKLLQNAAVGYTLLREDKLTNTQVVTEEKLARLARLRDVLETDYIAPTTYGENYLRSKKVNVKHLYLASVQKNKFTPNLPVDIGFKVLAMAKLHMLNFFHELRKYLCDNKYEFCYSDTDSLYFSISEETIDDCVKPEMKNEWMNEKRHELFVTNTGNDQFTPLLMKLEAEGSKFIGLSPKMYILCSNEDNLVKTASKGIPQELNANLITFSRFSNALFLLVVLQQQDCIAFEMYKNLAVFSQFINHDTHFLRYMLNVELDAI